MADKQLDDVRTQTTLKRLTIEKQYEETKERYEKERKKLTSQVKTLAGDANEKGDELVRVTQEKDGLLVEFNKISFENSEGKAELKRLRTTRNELTTEREDLIGDLKGHMAEIENVYQLNRELKSKIKRLEAVLYGKNIGGRR